QQANTIKLDKPLLETMKEGTQGFQSLAGKLVVEAQARRELERKCLTDGQGIAFFAHPWSGELPPYETVRIQLVCFNDCPGYFQDQLTCVVQGLSPVRMPVRVSITGSPLAISPHTPGVIFSHSVTKDAARRAASKREEHLPKLVWTPVPARAAPQ